MAPTIEALIGLLGERWSGVRVDARMFAMALEERAMATDAVHAVDVGLALAIATGDSAAIAVFDRQLIPDVRAALVRYGDADFVEEILQRTRVKLAVRDPDRPNPLLSYRGQGSLVGFVQIVAIREALMARRSARKENIGDEALVALAFMEPVLASAREVHKRELSAALSAAMAELETRERNLIRLAFLDGLNFEEIGRLYDVHRSTVMRWLRDARERLLQRTRQRFHAALKISDADVDSLMKSLAASLSVGWFGNDDAVG